MMVAGLLLSALEYGLLTLVLCLGSDSYSTRQRATETIKRLSWLEPLVLAHMNDSLETRMRSEKILRYWEDANGPQRGYYWMEIEKIGMFSHLCIKGHIVRVEGEFAFVEYSFAATRSGRLLIYGQPSGPTFSRIRWKDWKLTKVEE